MWSRGRPMRWSDLDRGLWRAGARGPANTAMIRWPGIPGEAAGAVEPDLHRETGFRRCRRLQKKRSPERRPHVFNPLLRCYALTSAGSTDDGTKGDSTHRLPEVRNKREPDSMPVRSRRQEASTRPAARRRHTHSRGSNTRNRSQERRSTRRMNRAQTRWAQTPQHRSAMRRRAWQYDASYLSPSKYQESRKPRDIDTNALQTTPVDWEFPQQNKRLQLVTLRQAVRTSVAGA